MLRPIYRFGGAGYRRPKTCFVVKVPRAAVVACGAAGAGAARGAATKAVKRAPLSAAVKNVQ